MPPPSSLVPSQEDIGKWERNARGTMIGEIITTKAKIETTWIFLMPDQLSLILTTIKPTFFSVTYIDPVENQLRTGTFYKGARTTPVMDYINGVLRYKDVKVNFIER
jgi:hypothetical protein